MSDKIQSVPGMSDLLPAHSSLWQVIEQMARQHFAVYGFSEIRVPLLEDTKLFARGIGEATQVVSKEMYTFTDRGGDSITLRPEGTAGVVRAYVQHSLHAQEPINKVYYLGPMFRYERPQKGRLRQFHQIGAETFGANSPTSDAEMIILVDRLVKRLGIDSYQLQINSLGSHEERKPFMEKLTQLLLGFKNQLCADCHKRLEKNPLRVFDCKNASCQALTKNAPTLLEVLGPESKQHFEAVCRQLETAGVAFVINPRIVRGLDYYEQTAFEFISDKLGSQSAFAGGGRYNRLVEELGGEPTSAVGFAIGMERLVMLVDANRETNPLFTQKNRGVFLASFDEADRIIARQLVQVLRDAGIRAEADFEPKSIKSQMRRANKQGFRFVAVIGENERLSQTVALKDLESGMQTSVAQRELVEKVKL